MEKARSVHSQLDVVCVAMYVRETGGWETEKKKKVFFQEAASKEAYGFSFYIYLFSPTLTHSSNNSSTCIIHYSLLLLWLSVKLPSILWSFFASYTHSLECINCHVRWSLVNALTYMRCLKRKLLLLSFPLIISKFQTSHIAVQPVHQSALIF